MTLDTSLIKTEIEKIRQEELIRLEIQRKLGVQKIEKRTALWAALNSNLCLWLLSAIFISGFGTLYTTHQNKEKERQKIEESLRLNKKNTLDRIDRLSMEFSYRLSTSLIRLESASILVVNDPTLDTNKLRSNAFAPLISSSKDMTITLYPEFKEISGLALIAELSTIVESGEKAELKEKITKLTHILNTPNSMDKIKPIDFKSMAGALLHKTKHWRWETGFPYTDCNKENPFC